MKYEVIKRFKERYQNFMLYEIGDTYSYQNEDRVAFLVKEGFLAPAPNQEETDVEIKHIGGGWYELPNGERVKGKEKALSMLGEDDA